MTILVADPDPPIAAWPASGEAIILDLEWTAWQGSLGRRWSEPWEYREVIAIGAVRVEAERFEECEEMEVFVRPARNPLLSDYITGLTGITDELLAARGLSFAEALARFTAFAGEAPILANGADGAVLLENCMLNDIPFPFPKGRIRTIRGALARSTGLLPEELVSAELPARLGFGAPPGRHGALSDAQAIRDSLARLRAQGRI